MKGVIDKISIRGFKSIRELEDFKLKNLNILIGANGAGKSNLVQIFRSLFWKTEAPIIFCTMAPRTHQESR